MEDELLTKGELLLALLLIVLFLLTCFGIELLAVAIKTRWIHYWWNR